MGVKEANETLEEAIRDYRNVPNLETFQEIPQNVHGFLQFGLRHLTANINDTLYQAMIEFPEHVNAVEVQTSINLKQKDANFPAAGTLFSPRDRLYRYLETQKPNAKDHVDYNFVLHLPHHTTKLGRTAQTIQLVHNEEGELHPSYVAINLAPYGGPSQEMFLFPDEIVSIRLIKVQDDAFSLRGSTKTQFKAKEGKYTADMHLAYYKGFRRATKQKVKGFGRQDNDNLTNWLDALLVPDYATGLVSGQQGWKGFKKFSGYALNTGNDPRLFAFDGFPIPKKLRTNTFGDISLLVAHAAYWHSKDGHKNMKIYRGADVRKQLLSLGETEDEY